MSRVRRVGAVHVPAPVSFGLLVFSGVLSVVDFFACVIDKRRARRGGRRVRERTLLLLALLGGSPGLLVGMVVVRHKVRKASFLARFLAVLALQVALVLFLFYEAA